MFVTYKNQICVEGRAVSGVIPRTGAGSSSKMRKSAVLVLVRSQNS